MKTTCIALFAMFSLTAGYGQDYPMADRASIDRLLRASRARPTYEMLAGRFIESTLTKIDIPEFVRLGELLRKEVFNWESVEEDLIATYQREFSDEDVRELVSFYESYVGQKMTQRMPLIVRGVMNLTEKRILAKHGVGCCRSMVTIFPVMCPVPTAERVGENVPHVVKRIVGRGNPISGEHCNVVRLPSMTCTVSD